MTSKSTLSKWVIDTRGSRICWYLRCSQHTDLRKPVGNLRAALQMPILGIFMPGMGMKSDARIRKRGHRGRTGKLSASTNIASALFSTTQQRLLGLLFGQPDRRFFANEIIGLTASGSGAIQRELASLTDSGLVNACKGGNRKYFQANKGSPLFEELRSIILKTVGAAGPLRAALNSLAPQIQVAFVYGSVAKRQDMASSDLDLLVVSDSLTLEDLYAAVTSAERQLSRKVSITLYTSSEYRRRLENRNPFLGRLIGDARELAPAG